MSEIQDAVQIIRVGYDGIEIAIKVGSAGIGGVKKVVDFLLTLLEQEKTLGRTSVRKLLMKGGDLQVFQYNTEDRKKVERMAKNYGILYAALPDINRQDGMSEIIFHSEGVPRVNMMIQKLKGGRIASIDDYLNNGNEKNQKIHSEKSRIIEAVMDTEVQKAHDDPANEKGKERAAHVNEMGMEIPEKMQGASGTAALDDAEKLNTKPKTR
ncbi:PcfB family protein [Anaerobium acetethylicum]|uniref:PcfB family protein n=1 Tax=Anaerobium acetethylicum TaxID=1619234 RepID=A0A1D3TUK0_9FIRM|nr:PcfB family protein [Anaerobium acetethylicum]SCP97751.1 Protein of unknown function [Anaerobium acetethylicum]